MCIYRVINYVFHPYGLGLPLAVFRLTFKFWMGMGQAQVLFSVSILEALSTIA